MFVYVFNVETITKVNGTVTPEPIQSPSSHDLQIYGIVVTIVLCFIVFGGVKMINRVAPAFLIPVLFSVFCIFIGIFLAGKDDPAGECLTLYKSFFQDIVPLSFSPFSLRYILPIDIYYFTWEWCLNMIKGLVKKSCMMHFSTCFQMLTLPMDQT